MSQRMRPSDIRYIQSDIAPNFSDGTDLLDTFNKLVRGSVSPDGLGPIEVVPYNGLNYAFDGNRRLLLFKKLEQAGKLSTISVKVKNKHESGVMMKYSTKDNGASVRVRGSTNIEAEMDRILRQG